MHCENDDAMTMNDAIEAFLTYVRDERRLSSLTVLKYSENLYLFADFLADPSGIVDIEQVSHREVREWQMHLTEDGYKSTTVKTMLVALRTFFKFLRRQGWIDTDVMVKVTPPKTPRHLPVFFTEKEVGKIYDTSYFGDDFGGQRDQLMLRMLYETGMRRAELLGLTDGSVDFHKGSVKVLGKRDKERIIPLEKELLDNINSYFSLKKEIEGCSEAFFVRDDGSPFTQNDVAKVVKKYMSQFSNADRISPHVFRHSFATHLLNEGADISAIKELLGHTDLTATEVYTHVSRQHLKETYKHTHPREKGEE